MVRIKKVKSAYEPIVAHQTEAYPGFYSMKRLGVFLFPPEGDTNPWQGYPQHLGGKRHHESSVLPKNTTQCPLPGLELGPLAPESSALTMRPTRLPLVVRAPDLKSGDRGFKSRADRSAVVVFR